MDLQSIFYVVSIIFLLLCITMMVAVIYFLWKLERSISELKTQAVDRVQGFMQQGGTGLLSMVGVGLTSFIMKRIKEKIRGNRA